MKRLYALSLGLPLVAAMAIHYGCGSSDGAGGTAGGAASGTAYQGGAGGGAAAGGTAGGAASGNSGGGGLTGGGGVGADAGVFDADFGYDAPPFDADLQDACVDETATADPVPLDIYFMLDRSGSMTEPICTNCTGGDCDVTWPSPPAIGSKWCRAINAIAGYITDASADGNRAAIEYFSASTCSGYDTPAVGLVNLTAQAGQIITSMDAQQPWSGTPTRPALEGLAAFTAANQTPGRVIIGILITDGEPTTCSPYDDTTLSAITQNHWTNNNIHTFIIGMDGISSTGWSRLETWASYSGALSHDDTNDACGTCSGGGCTCHHYNVGDGDPTVFIWALQQIQNSVLGCTFVVPDPASGVLDPDAVIVEYYPNGSSTPEELVRVPNAGACTGADNEWYYDDNVNPTTINLCPATCTRVEADPNPSIQIRIACQGS